MEGCQPNTVLEEGRVALSICAHQPDVDFVESVGVVSVCSDYNHFICIHFHSGAQPGGEWK